MATGIISIGLHLTDFEVLSVLWLVLAVGAWLVLAADFTMRLLSDHDRWRGEADTPPALTAVAATTVLGTRLALLGWSVPAVFALVTAIAVWPLLLPFVIRRRGARMPGAAFPVCVSTQGIAVLSATLAAREHAPWLDWVGLLFWCGGLVLSGLAFGRFDLRQVWTGRGDQWLAAGALAISTLAGARLLGAQWSGPAHQLLRTLTLILLALNLIGYVILLLAEFTRPRPDYDIRHWATIFPLGTTAVAVYTTAGVIDVPGLSALGRILLFVAVVAWLYTLVALLRKRVRVERV